jgi:hypothetical protein
MICSSVKPQPLFFFVVFLYPWRRRHLAAILKSRTIDGVAAAYPPITHSRAVSACDLRNASLRGGGHGDMFIEMAVETPVNLMG